MNVCVFCGARSGRDPRYAQAAEGLGALLAEAGLGLVYGGGQVGLMGIVADSTLKAGGEVIGVIPRSMVDRELAHPGLTKLIVTAGMHERKATMETLSGAFIALPGGFGTLDELCEIVTWAQLGDHRKPVYLLNIAGYFDEFIAFVEKSVREGFVGVEQRPLLQVSDSLGDVVSALKALKT